jgi:uncharacterized repeat protein (TIGR02543 family)
MRKRWLIALWAILAIGLVGEAWAVPPFPHTFYGTVKKDGANVPDGTLISAWIGGVEYASVSTFTFGADSVYTFKLPGDDQETAEKEGGVGGEVISFSLGGEMAAQTAVFSSGSVTQLDITISQFSLGVLINPSDSGYVSRNPDKSVYNLGEQVILTAAGNPGYTFSGWSGDGSGATNPVTITIDGNKTVTASFTQDQYTLGINVSPLGVGSVSRSPDKATYDYGDQVQLTMAGNPGYTFSG